MPSATEWAPALEGALTLLRAAGYEPAGDERFAIGRPDRTAIPLLTRDGRPAVAKIFPGEQCARTFANMQALWCSSFGARRNPAGIPQPLACFPEVGLLVMERLEGEPLAALSKPGKELFDESIRLLAELHASDAKSDKERSARGVVRSARRKAARVAALMPQHVAAMQRAVDLLEVGRVGDSELVPSHGDFSPRNILVAPGRLALIDFDRFQMADPCRDLAYLGTSDWADALRRGRRADEGLLKRAVKVYEAASGKRVSKRRLNFHIAAALIRRAASLVELWPAEAWLAPALCNAAVRVLERNQAPAAPR
ncbi:MAG TPA: aminoglycoside phosphotransferase family protein [Verrucomicrobiae bacterium]|jgi:aminoglycoside phosphotransferase (APT) family kinase protein